MKPAISIVIPALNEAASIGRTVDAAMRLGTDVEVIVVDGGSEDDTAGIAQWCGARVLDSERGRGRQMHAGALAAQADILWFLHADTVAPVHACEFILEALSDHSVAGGNFCLRFDGSSSGARALTFVYPHLRKIGLKYGDSGIFVRKSVYEQVGGFQPYPIFEDLDFLRRAARYGKFVNVACSLTTSSRRFEGRSFTLQFAHWSALQILYWAGVSPHRIGRYYSNARKR